MYYSWNLGPIHFIAFNTEFYYPNKTNYNTILVEQFHWIQKNLIEANKPRNREKRPWIITYGHRPMYCTNLGSVPDCRRSRSNLRDGIRTKKQRRVYGLETLFMENGVDISFWGHVHQYARFWPIYQYRVRNGSEEEPYKNPKAPVHITSGSPVRRKFVIRMQY